MRGGVVGMHTTPIVFLYIRLYRSHFCSDPFEVLHLPDHQPCRGAGSPPGVSGFCTTSLLLSRAACSHFSPGAPSREKTKKRGERGMHVGYHMGSRGHCVPGGGPPGRHIACRGSAWGPARGAVQGTLVHARCRMGNLVLPQRGAAGGRLYIQGFCMYPCRCPAWVPYSCKKNGV